MQRDKLVDYFLENLPFRMQEEYPMFFYFVPIEEEKDNYFKIIIEPEKNFLFGWERNKFYTY